MDFSAASLAALTPLAPYFLIYLAAGALVGFLAGLLGIGGGMTLVPILAALFTAQHLADQHTVHLALATAMASAAFTSTASVREHHKLGGVDWALAKRLIPAMLAGSLIATVGAAWVSQRWLALAFAVIVYAGATQIWLGRKPSAHGGLPGSGPLTLIGLVIGLVCGLVSAGGAFLTVPFMLYCGIPIQRAIGTAAAVSVPIAAVGAIGWVVSGHAVSGLPSYTIGFIYVPALLAIVATSMFLAPIGARVSHKMPVTVLKRIFACFLYILATKMLWTYL